MRRVVTLLTDFGLQDPYAAAMKGVILSRCPDASIVDLSHEIPPQDVFAAALFLAAAVPFFPKGTVHCVVVDPGVGTARLPIALEAGDQFFVAPDNGVVSLHVRRHPVGDVRMISIRHHLMDTISATFHGRDIFAPAAAALARGTSLEELGEHIGTLTMLEVPVVKKDGHCLTGVVMHVDRFGNAIANIRREDFEGGAPCGIRAGRARLDHLSETYGDVEAGKPLALFGSSGYLEIAVNRGNAHAQLGIGRGHHVEVQF